MGFLYSPELDPDADTEKDRPPIFNLTKKNQTRNIKQVLNKKQTRFFVNR